MLKPFTCKNIWVNFKTFCKYVQLCQNLFIRKNHQIILKILCGVNRKHFSQNMHVKIRLHVKTPESFSRFCVVSMKPFAQNMHLKIRLHVKPPDHSQGFVWCQLSLCIKICIFKFMTRRFHFLELESPKNVFC